ncbi:MAG: phage terminase small subunit P27 family [Planctomycetia bacterium]|nr:phage terminase small subunit P27 family [Planctomycetia bacterium]
MVRGRKPKPTHLKMLAGNPGKRPLNKHEPVVDKAFPPCPERLQGKAREAWERFSQELSRCGVGTNLDAVALELLCECYAAHQEAAEQVAKLGPVWIEKQAPGKLPKFSYSPFWVIQKNEHKKLVALLTEFGMTPSSRSRVVADNPYPDSNPKAKYFKW